MPEFGSGSESPMAGPVYRYDPGLDSGVKFPEAYDGDFFAGEFGRRWIKRIERNADGTVAQINDFPWTGTQIMDMEFGPDGALYVLDYGVSWFQGDENSALYRIENAEDGFSPIAEAGADRTSGPAGLKVTFTGSAQDADSPDLTYSWDFGDGTTGEGLTPTHRYRKAGTYTATFTARDPEGNTGNAGVRIVVGNTAPKVRIDVPGNGTLAAFGEPVPFKVTVTDPEETIDCSRVKVAYSLGHDSHAHELTSETGCEGTLTPPAGDGGHDPNADIYGVVGAGYTDGGANGQEALTGTARTVLQPLHRQAEHFTTQSGIRTYDKTGANGGRTVGDIDDGDWISFSPYRFDGQRKMTVRASSGGAGGFVELRTGSPGGPLHGSAYIPPTGGWETFQNVDVPLRALPKRTTEIYLVFRGGAGALFDVDDFEFSEEPFRGGKKVLSSVASTVMPAGAPSSFGYEIQIDATDAPDRTTGSVSSFKPADIKARDRVLRPPGQWNSYEIKVQGERLQVFLNGVEINDFTNEDTRRSLTDGCIGLQNHGADDQVSFRDVQLKELPVTGD
ncbi:hypothetical protein GCM10020295_13630 [Streptomyces cinereospinus]